MPRPRVGAPVAALLLLIAVVASCAEPEATPEPSRPQVATVMVDLPGATPEQMNAAADVVRQRLLALDLQVGEVGWDDASIEVIVPADDEELVRTALAPIGELEVRPVLEVLDPSTAPTTTPLAERSPEATVGASAPDGTVYRLGPSVLGPAGVESATATSTPDGQWTVGLVLREGADGIDAFNALAADCFAATDACPAVSVDGHGMVAILLDGVVLSAPTIQVAEFERDQIQISGTFDERAARGLAAALDGGAAGLRWTVRD